MLVGRRPLLRWSLQGMTLGLGLMLGANPIERRALSMPRVAPGQATYVTATPRSPRFPERTLRAAPSAGSAASAGSAGSAGSSETSQATEAGEAPEPLRADPSTAMANALTDPTVDLVVGQEPPRARNESADLDRAGLLAEGAEDSGEVALTFDDGPAEGTTEEVLAVLARHRVKGAFFLVGSRLQGQDEHALRNRSIAREIARAGHVIGNHGYEHRGLLRLDEPWTERQIGASAALIADATGVMPRLFRPPFGAINDLGRQLLAARQDELVLWTLDAQDIHEPDPALLARKLEGQLAYAGQGIVLLHDTHAGCAKTVDLLLQWIAAQNDKAATAEGNTAAQEVAVRAESEHGPGSRRPRYTVVDVHTFLQHAAEHPYPYRNRIELYYARERAHAARSDAN